jgi:hypothetical protein
MIEEAFIWSGSTVCHALRVLGSLDGPAEACSSSRDMLVFGGLMIFLGAVALTMLSVIGRGIRPA